ncbi:alpha/beta hydrolase [Tsukamurella sp. 1534]|uniref:alpha/beta hydrolase n=1 Tax=Tsukamurella sp. 1534 TaxID=1151061 RepID=UPI0002F115C8|nr:alpha/beta hydrolase [Tsukamurella sp. 1534]
MTVVGEAPGAWRGRAADAYAGWAAAEARLVREVESALRRAEAEIASGGADLADRLAVIDLPLAVPLGAPPTPVTGARPRSAATRDAENRARLAGDLRRLRGRPLTAGERRELARAEAIDARLRALDGAVDPVTGARVPVLLHEYEPRAFRGDGIVVVAIGDLDAAENVGVLVPGMGTTAGSVGAVTGDALRLYEAARRADPGRSTATLAWIGYDAPSGGAAVARVITRDAADRGAAQLREDLADIAALRAGSDPRIVLFGHSYGAVTAATAGAGGALVGTVDAMVLLGSPGAGPVRSAAELGLPVYVARDSDDPVPAAAGTDPAARGLRRFGIEVGLGTDPAAPSFGATPIDAEGPTGPGAGAHSGYYRPGSPALDAFARILTGGGGGR